MESKKFDILVRDTFEVASRRSVVQVGVGALAASALVTLGLRSHDAEAKNKKKKKRCKGNRPVKCGKGCCQSNFSQCCGDASDPANSRTCNPTDFTCCPLADGGGSCPTFQSQCCPPTEFEPFGSCAGDTATCCTTEQGGGACPEDRPVCCILDCCEDGATCCGPDGACPDGFVCELDGEEGFCCVPEALAAAKAAPDSKGRKVHRQRFMKKAK